MKLAVVAFFLGFLGSVLTCGFIGEAVDLSSPPTTTHCLAIGLLLGAALGVIIGALAAASAVSLKDFH